MDEFMNSISLRNLPPETAGFLDCLVNWLHVRDEALSALDTG